MAPTRSLQRAAWRPTRASKKVLLACLPGTDARRDGSSLPAAQHALEQLDVLAGVRGPSNGSHTRVCAAALRAVRVIQELAHAPRNACRLRGSTRNPVRPSSICSRSRIALAGERRSPHTDAHSVLRTDAQRRPQP